MLVAIEVLERVERGLGTKADTEAVIAELYGLRFDLRVAEEKYSRASAYIDSIYAMRDTANGL